MDSLDSVDATASTKLYRGASPSNYGTELTTAQMPACRMPITIAPERREEFAPGLDAELHSLIQATAEIEIKARTLPRADPPSARRGWVCRVSHT